MAQHISEEAKQVIIKKALNNNSQTMSALAIAHNVSVATLSRWLKPFRQNSAINNKVILDAPTPLNGCCIK